MGGVRTGDRSERLRRLPPRGLLPELPAVVDVLRFESVGLAQKSLAVKVLHGVDEAPAHGGGAGHEFGFRSLMGGPQLPGLHQIPHRGDVGKDVDVPGDFVINMDAIVDEIERQLQVSCMPEDYEYCGVTDNTSYYGFNPWEDWDIRPKMSIFLMTDENAEGLISGASGDDLVICDYAMYSEDVWNSNPDYYASDFRVRFDYVDYYTVAHELTHTITLRQSHMTDIMTEGIAEYMSREVVNALAPDYPSIGECKAEAEKYLYDAEIPEKVNADNAERIFISDYQDIDHAHRGAEYVTGRYLCQFLDENYGDDFYLKYKEQIDKDGIDYGYGDYTEEVRINYANALKEAFGDDVFTKFGDWCVENHALQELGGVWPDLY